MSDQIIRQPFMLLETVSMLYRYVNGISMQSDLNQTRQRVDPAVFAEINRRAGWIQEIIYSVCKGLDQTDPEMIKYFQKVELDKVDVCLAIYVTNLMCFTATAPGYWAGIEEIRQYWHDVQNKGMRINPIKDSGFDFLPAAGEPVDLFAQVKAMNLPAEFRLELYEMLMDFDRNLQKLAELMEPYAIKLEQAYQEHSWLFDETVAHWESEFKKMPPLDFVFNTAGKYCIADRAGETIIGISLMNSHSVIIGLNTDDETGEKTNILILGGCLTSESVLKKKSRDFEQIGTRLKYLGDRKRLEILYRLNKEQGYGFELSESMGVDTGNMSRTLSQLHQYGFLSQEKGSLRNYYRTDKAAVRDFLKQVEIAILGEEE